MFIIPIILSGCLSTKEGEKSMRYEKAFGTYEILNGWIEEKTHSTNDVFFYVKEETEKNNQPNNIAISEGENKFKKSEHENFKKAIMSQLNAQMNKNSDVKIVLDGLTTKSENIVYVVKIKEKELETRFYYIVGEYRFVMVQATCFDDSENVYKVSERIVDSFVWNKK